MSKNVIKPRSIGMSTVEWTVKFQVFKSATTYYVLRYIRHHYVNDIGISAYDMC